ncbi:hypothetical protein Fcan01_05925 [Folsomia candida]|uniref:Uncharacterized protein n=1 Tax=Folsomia candida TaxID=158441 RepID=A0A226EQW5_FOLCA|nr:hypothetical protein Fcan01_05925 [Folsomia candida]
MAQFQGIVNQLQNENNHHFGFGIFVPVPPLPFPELENIWEWKRHNGMPVFQDPQSEWTRYLPSPTYKFAESRLGRVFASGWRKPVQTFKVNCSSVPGTLHNNLRSLLALIYKSDLKKLRVRRSADGNSIIVQKMRGDLKDFDAIYHQIPIRTKNGRISRTVEDINRNGARMKLDPGSFPCRHARCRIGDLMTQSSTVKWGPGEHQVVHVRKRFTCSSNNVVYLIHCHACVQLGLWTTYVEESNATRNLHSRISNHVSNLGDQENRDLYPTGDLYQEITAILNGAHDPHSLLRDPYVHFNFIHSKSDRRYTFLDGGFSSDQQRRNCEFLYKQVCGNFVYTAATNSGSLNKFN